MSVNTATAATAAVDPVGIESGCRGLPLPGACGSARAIASADWAAQALSAAAVARAQVCGNECLEEEPERWDGLS